MRTATLLLFCLFSCTFLISGNPKQYLHRWMLQSCHYTAMRFTDAGSLFIYSVLQILVSSNANFLKEEIPKTHLAKLPPNELWCYRCSAADSHDRCVNIKQANNSLLAHKCSNDRRLCMVKRFSYTTSNENSTSLLKMWSLERNCTKHCEPGCIVIGERTKLYACTSCCDKSFCNYGSWAGNTHPSNVLIISSILLYILKL